MTLMELKCTPASKERMHILSTVINPINGRCPIILTGNSVLPSALITSENFKLELPTRELPLGWEKWNLALVPKCGARMVAFLN